MRIFVVALIFAFFFDCFATDVVIEQDYLFIAHDAGESNFMIPILAELKKRNTYNMTILCLGEPATSLFSNYEEAITLSDLGIDVDIEDGTSDRSQKLTHHQMDTLLHQLKPKVVLEGMVYQMQAQIGQGFHMKKMKYYEIFKK